MKPSELNPQTAPLMEKLVHKYMDPECFRQDQMHRFPLTESKKTAEWSRVVQGAVPETTALLNNRWDHIFYTGWGWGSWAPVDLPAREWPSGTHCHGCGSQTFDHRNLGAGPYSFGGCWFSISHIHSIPHPPCA